MEYRTERYSVPGGICVVGDVGGDPANPCVVLQHGGGQTRHSWGGAMRKLIAKGYHVVNLDARGHGDSDWAPDGDYSFEAQSSDLRAVISTLRSPPALVGASMGGACSLYTVGRSECQLASALILVDMIPRIRAEGAAKIATFMRARPEGFANLEEAADAVAAYNPNRPRPRDPSGLMKNLRLRPDGRLRWHWDPRFAESAKPVEPPGFRRLLMDAAAAVRIPTLLVWGLNSDIVSEEGIQEFKAQLPALEIYGVKSAGHMVAGDKNDAFNHGILAFLQRHMPAAPGSPST